MTETRDLTALFDALEDVPDDRVTLLALADWFEDQDRSMAAGCLRWLAASGKLPYRYFAASPLRYHHESWAEGWFWWTTESEMEKWGYPQTCELPFNLWDRLRHTFDYKPTTFKEYPRIREACEALVDAWTALPEGERPVIKKKRTIPRANERPATAKKKEKVISTPGGVRTPNLCVRSAVLYPVELRARRSPERTIPKTLDASLASVTVRAAHFTLRDFPRDRFPRVIAEHVANVASLRSANVVELKANYVGVSTDNTRMFGEVGEHALLLFFENFVVSGSGFLQVVRLVVLIMPLHLQAGTSPATDLTGPTTLVLPVEVFQWFDRLTPGAAFLIHVSILMDVFENSVITLARHCFARNRSRTDSFARRTTHPAILSEKSLPAVAAAPIITILPLAWARRAGPA